jgi:hypothetical protein
VKPYASASREFIPSMVDLEEYESPDWEAARSETARWLRQFGAAARVVVYAGRLDPRKRVDEFIHAAQAVEAECPQAFFLIVGGPDAYRPEHEQEVKVLARDLVERGRLAFLGTRCDVPGILSAALILVLPSSGEGMAHVISEAGAAGLAVVRRTMARRRSNSMTGGSASSSSRATRRSSSTRFDRCFATTPSVRGWARVCGNECARCTPPGSSSGSGTSCSRASRRN